MAAVAWTAIGLLAATIGLLGAALFTSFHSLAGRIDGLGAGLHARIDGLKSTLNGRIDNLGNRIDGFEAESTASSPV